MQPTRAQALFACLRHGAAAERSVVTPGELVVEADRRGVAGLVARRLLESGAELDEATREALSARLARERRHRAIHRVEVDRAVTAVSGAGIPVVVLKGPPLLVELYDDLADREFRDIDLLVPADRFEDVREALRRIGYGLAIDDRLAAIYRRHHFHWLLGGPGKPHLELHWDLSRPDDPFRLDPAGFLEDARPPTGEVGWHAPSRHRQLLHAVVDLAVGGAGDLKRLVDVDRLLRAGLEIPPRELAGRAGEIGAERAVALVLELAAELLGSPSAQWLPHLDRRGLDPLRPVARASALRGPDPRGEEPLLAAWLRYRLSPPGRGRLRRLLFRSGFDRARLAADGLGPVGRAAAHAKRALRIAALRVRHAGGRPGSRLTHPSSSSS